MKIVLYIVFLSYAYHCHGRSLPEAAENVPLANDDADDFKNIKSGFFKIPKTNKGVQMHDIIHHLKGAILEKHVNSDESKGRRKRGTNEGGEEYSQKEEYCAPRYNLGSSIYHKDVNIAKGGSVVNIGNLYLYQYSPNGDYQRQIPVPGYNMPIISKDEYHEEESQTPTD